MWKLDGPYLGKLRFGVAPTAGTRVSELDAPPAVTRGFLAPRNREKAVPKHLLTLLVRLSRLLGCRRRRGMALVVHPRCHPTFIHPIALAIPRVLARLERVCDGALGEGYHCQIAYAHARLTGSGRSSRPGPDAIEMKTKARRAFAALPDVALSSRTKMTWHQLDAYRGWDGGSRWQDHPPLSEKGH